MDGRRGALHELEEVAVGPPGAERRALLKDRAYDELKRLILTGTYPPGTFLSERQLAAQLAMSKTPIRAALERLAAEGFVAVSPQQGIVVRERSLHEIVDLFDLRIALETFVVRRLAGQLPAAGAGRLRVNLAAQDECAHDGDLARAAHLDAQFHLTLCECLDNHEITTTLAHLRDKLDRTIYTILSRDAGRVSDSYKEHMGIVEAIVAADRELAATRMERHLTWGKTFLVSR